MATLYRARRRGSLNRQWLVERFREELAAQRAHDVVERLPGTSHGFATADLLVHDPAAARP